MTAMLLTAGSAFAAWAGMAALCFQSDSQRRRLHVREQTVLEKSVWIAAGVVLLAISAAALVAADGVQFGLLLCLCQAGMLGLALICAMPFARTAVSVSAVSAALLAPLTLAAARWI